MAVTNSVVIVTDANMEYIKIEEVRRWGDGFSHRTQSPSSRGKLGGTTHSPAPNERHSFLGFSGKVGKSHARRAELFISSLVKASVESFRPVHRSRWLPDVPRVVSTALALVSTATITVCSDSSIRFRRGAAQQLLQMHGPRSACTPAVWCVGQ